MFRKILAQFDAVDGPFIDKISRLDRSVSRFERSTIAGFGRVEKGMNGMLNSASRLQAITGVIGAGFGTRMAAGFVDQSKQIRNALREAGDESQEMYEKVYRASVRSLSGFQDFAGSVQRFQKAFVGEQGLDQTIRDMETLNKLLALSGKTAQEQASTMTQFSQALQAGYLQGEELRAIRENAPLEFTKAIAREAGGSIEDLKDLAAAGELTKEVMVRALRSLESEADRRFKNIEITIGHAATVFKNGAIVAAEGFDEGLGLSSAAIDGLRTVGDILGSDADAAETFGRAVKFAGVALAASFAGRRVNGYAQGLQQLSKARYADAAAADAQVAATNKRVVSATAQYNALQQRLVAEQRQGVTSRAAIALDDKTTKARNRLNAATLAHTNATLAASRAQQRLLLSSRLLAGGANALRGAFAFLGGLPGLILIAGTALLTMGSNAETAAEKLDRLTAATGTLGSGSAELAAITERLNAAISDRGKTSLEAAEKIIAATRAEYEAKKDLLRLDKREAQHTQAERIKELIRLEKELAGQPSIQDRYDEIYLTRGSFARMDASVEANIWRDAERSFDEDTRELRSQIDRYKATVEIAAQEIVHANSLIGQSFDPSKPAEFIEQVTKAEELARKFIEQNTTAEEKRRAVIEEVRAAREKLVAQYGEESAVVQSLDAAMAQFQQEMRDTKKDTDNLTSSAYELGRALSAIGSVHLGLEDRIAVAEAKLRAAQAGASSDRVSAVGQAQAQSIDLVRKGASPDQLAEAYTRTVELNLKLSETEGLISDIFDEGSSSGGGGGGETRLEKAEKEALQFVESMMTARERQRQTLKKMADVRAVLVERYGQESGAVQQLDEAIERSIENANGLKDAYDNFFDGMADQIANAITDWKGFGNLVRSILASIVAEHGVDFFTALLTPGASKSDSLGSKAGDLLASVLHDGGTAGSDGKRRSVPSSLFASAPRYHQGTDFAGLKPGEIPAILERGEKVLKRGTKVGGDNVSIAMANDFRAMDGALRQEVMAQLARLENSIPAKVRDTISALKRTRTPT